MRALLLSVPSVSTNTCNSAQPLDSVLARADGLLYDSKRRKRAAREARDAKAAAKVTKA